MMMRGNRSDENAALLSIRICRASIDPLSCSLPVFRSYLTQAYLPPLGSGVRAWSDESDILAHLV